MYFIDTDILSYYLRDYRAYPRLFLWLEELTQEELFTTVINYSEILFGCKSAKSIPRGFEKEVKHFLSQFNIYNFDTEAADIYVNIKARLKLKGQILPDADLMIASIVIANNGVLVTHNIKHFSRISGLNLEDWMVH